MGHYVEASLSEKVEWYLLNVADEETVIHMHNVIQFEENGNGCIYPMEEFDEIIEDLEISPSTLASACAKGKFNPWDCWFRFDERGYIDTFTVGRDTLLSSHGVDHGYIAEKVVEYAEDIDDVREIVNNALAEYDGEYDKYAEDEAV